MGRLERENASSLRKQLDDANASRNRAIALSSEAWDKLRWTETVLESTQSLALELQEKLSAEKVAHRETADALSLEAAAHAAAREVARLEGQRLNNWIAGLLVAAGIMLGFAFYVGTQVGR